MDQTTPTTSNMKSYGSTEPSLRRNEVSVGGGTTLTTESEPLLGERWANEEDETPIPSHPTTPATSKLDESKPFYTDASTIDREDSDDDPHIGINVFTNDNLSYSRDDSTLGLNDRYWRGGTPRGSRMTIDEDIEEEEGGRRGFFMNIIPGQESNSQVYFLVCFGLAVGIALCSVAALLYVEYWHHYGVDVLPDPVNGTGGGSGGGKVNIDASWHGVPFAKVARKSFGDPVSSIVDVDLFHPSLLYRENAKKALQEEAVAEPFFKFPFPTGAFWTNLVLLPVSNKPETQQEQQVSKRKLISSTNPNNSRSENQYSYPIVAYPYAFQWSSMGKLQASYSAARRTIKPDSIQDAFAPDISFGSSEDILSRHVVSFDSLSVTLRFYTDDSTSSSGFWESYIVQGSPYVTARYYGLTPELTALSDFKDITCPPTMTQLKVKTDEQSTLASNNLTKRGLSSTSSATGTDTSKMLGICDLSDESNQHSKIITGVQFIVTTKEGLTWLVFASEPITFVFDQNARHTIASKDLFGGVIRVALVPPASSNSNGSMSGTSVDNNYLAASPGVKRLIYHADTYPIGGSVHWDFRSGTRSSLASALSRSSSGHRELLSLIRKKEPSFTTTTTSSSSKDSNIATLTFQFDVMHMTSTPSSKVSLLTLALPHHASFISSAEEMLLQPTEFDLDYYSIKGRLTPVIGNSWSYEEDLTSIGFGDEPTVKPSPSSSTATTTKTTTTPVISGRHQTISELTAVAALDQSVRDLILDTLTTDIKLNLPDNNNGAYGFGKQIARLAQLAHVAERVEAENGSTSVNSRNNTGSGATARRTYALLQMYLTMWLTGDDGSSGSLVYDASLGGILSKEGMKDPYSDFGNGRYNDHHFHYGYVLYAAAILGRRNPQFISQYGSYIDAIFYDVAHNSNAVVKNGKRDDAYFPLSRHKSWFDGHSFASGLFPFADGKSQESSSEATNCYYGAYLWAKVRWGGTADGIKLVNFARVLLATELTGAKTYWHMVPAANSVGSRRLSNGTATFTTWQPPPAFNSVFEHNYMVGNLGMTDVTCSTWFGTENIYVHLINFMPVTAITTELFDKAYVKEERKVLNDGVSVDNSWKGYVISHKAILDPNSAWIEAQDLISNQLDPGLSKSQVLYWISTRDGFSASTTAVTTRSNTGDSDLEATTSQKGDNSSPQPNSSTGDSSCESHASCFALNLSGQCCPTEENVYLGCCT